METLANAESQTTAQTPAAEAEGYRITRLHPFGLKIEPSDPGTPIGELDIAELRAHFRKEQFLLLRGFGTFQSSAEFAAYCGRFGEIALWPFGAVLELLERENPEDHIFDHNAVPLHWDGMYRPHVPEYQIFHCVIAPPTGTGGRTTFSNTVSALRDAPAATRALWSRVTGVYRRKMEYYDSKTVSPVVTRHPRTGIEVIRYNEPPSAEGFLNPPDLRFTGASAGEIAEAHRSLKEALYSPAHFYAHEWQPGDVVIADNFSLLHGREGFVSRSPRHLQRVHVQSDPPFANPGLEFHQ